MKLKSSYFTSPSGLTGFYSDTDSPVDAIGAGFCPLDGSIEVCIVDNTHADRPVFVSLNQEDAKTFAEDILKLLQGDTK